MLIKLTLSLQKCFKNNLCLTVFFFFIFFSASSQCLTNNEFQVLINHTLETVKEKLPVFYDLKTKFEKCNLPRDSTYAQMLFYISFFEFTINKNYSKSLEYILSSIKINTSGGKGCSAFYAMRGYYDAGYFYCKGLRMNDEALTYCDSAQRIAENRRDDFSSSIISQIRMLRADIYFEKGDFEKQKEESIEGMKFSLQKKDSAGYLYFLNQKVFSLVSQNRLSEAVGDLQFLDILAKKLHADDQAGFALKTKAVLYDKKKDYPAAYAFFRESIRYNISIKDSSHVWADYVDWGNVYVKLHEYKKAQTCFLKASAYARERPQLSIIQINMEDCSFKEKKHAEAVTHLFKSLEYLNLDRNILVSPLVKNMKSISDKDLVLTILRNKAELLLGLFQKTKDAKYLTASIQTALVTDSVITSMRREQTGEQSKLYWRDGTREFYTSAMEACLLANDADHAFFFMEKSRAVLLNDKLVELGAAAHLPVTEAAIQRSLQINIITAQQKLLTLNNGSKEYDEQEIKLILAKNEFDKYIKSLEQKYPVYYQYKYADEVPSLRATQKWLNVNRQSFVHYFMNDTAAYILAVTANNTKLIKLTGNDFNAQQLNRFIDICSNKDSLNNQYTTFALLSHELYKKLFEPLQLAKGSVIICQDKYFIPLEALCTDNTGKKFLLADYSISYAYSARSLMMKVANTTAKKDFLGIAPVSFSSYLNVPDLKESADYLRSASGCYSQTKLLTNAESSKSNFLLNFPDYAVVNIFSHASVNISSAEPCLYMSDSTLKLSEIGLISNPSTQLVVLSACQTNNGKNATGEGVYSIARSFAANGVPAVMATLWNADEHAIYLITENFHKNLSLGMNKDEALRKAKLTFIESSNSENRLPYYWANLIIVGNTESIKLSVHHSWWWWVVGGSIIILILVGRLWKKNKFISL